MKEKTLLKTALICAVLGTALLMFLADKIEVKESNINELEDGDDAKVSGVIKRITNVGNLTFIEIETTQIITALAFDNVNLEKGSYIEVIGSVQEYEGKKELIIDEIIQ